MMRQLLFIISGLLAVIGVPIQAKVASEAIPLNTDEELIDKPRPSTRYLSCSYAGDPHLIPFYEPYNQYWCRNPGWELLLSNQYVSLYVKVLASGNHVITDYKLVFADSTCGMGTASSPISASCGTITALPTGFNAFAYFHNSGQLTIRIENNGNHINFFIWQSERLVRQSCGVCVKWNCKPETLWMTPNPAVPNLCDIYIKTAVAHATADVDQRIIEIGTTQCINDVQTTFNLQFAKSAMTLVLQDNIKNLSNVEEAQAAFKNLEEIEQKAFKMAAEKTKDILGESARICNDQSKCLQASDFDAANQDVLKNK